MSLLWPHDAKERAITLLSAVTPLQLDQAGTAIVIGEKFMYRLIPDQRTHVLRKKDGKYIGVACIVFEGWHPAADRMIAEYILIKNDESQYLRTANLSSSIMTVRNRPAAFFAGLCVALAIVSIAIGITALVVSFLHR